MECQSIFQVCYDITLQAMADDNNSSIDNYTYSIDLSSSWTNKTVVFNQIQKNTPVLNYGTLWPDSTNSSFYAWAGEVSQALPLIKCNKFLKNQSGDLQPPVMDQAYVRSNQCPQIQSSHL